MNDVTQEQGLGDPPWLPLKLKRFWMLIDVRYQLVLDEAALNQLRALPKAVRRNIGHRLDLLQDSLQGDVKKLTGEQHRYRLRVGAYRVLFRLDGRFTCML